MSSQAATKKASKKASKPVTSGVTAEVNPTFSTESLFPVQEFKSEVSPMSQVNWFDLVNEETPNPPPITVSTLSSKTLVEAWKRDSSLSKFYYGLSNILNQHQPSTWPLTIAIRYIEFNSVYESDIYPIYRI